MTRVWSIVCAMLLAIGVVASAQTSITRRLRGPSSDLPILALTDLTPLGAFEPPNPTGDDIDFGNGLALRRVAGTPYLYMTGFAGNLVEFTIPADEDLATAAPFTTATATGQYGDIFQTAGYQSVVSDGGSGGPKEGLAGGWRPNNLFWDETDSRMYWTAFARYDNDAYPIASDNALGYSTLDFVAKTGTGIATWKLAARRNGTSTDAMTDVGNRWTNGLTHIPSGFATTYLSGKRLAVGFGDPSVSIATNGPISMGPALFAFDPATLNVAQDRDYFAGSLHKLIFHPFFTTVAAPLAKLRPVGVPVNVYQGSASPNYDAFTTYVSWIDQIGGGVWIRGTKEGLVIPSLGPTGSMSTTISASPTPTNTVFTVGDIGDTAVGDRIFFQTVETQPQGNYPWAYAVVTGISGQQLTVTAPVNAQTETTDTTIAYAGGFCFSGTRYQGGGNKGTRVVSMVYIYSAAQLALSAQGSLTASAIAPTAEGLKDLPGVTFPVRAYDTMRIIGVAYDSVTCRLYVALKDIPTTGALVSVFGVAAC